MKSKIAVVLVTITILVSFSCTAFANTAPTFADVPANHWSYEAISYLAKNGIIDGYDDKNFQGNKTMTRYEMAQIVAKALARQDKYNIAQQAVLDKLAAEYAMEMTQIKQLDARLTKVEKNQSKIKFNGSYLMQWKTKTRDKVTLWEDWTRTQSYFRLNGDVTLDKNTSVGFRVYNSTPGTGPNQFRSGAAIKGGYATNTQIDRSFVTTKVFDGVTATIGRQAAVMDPEDVIIDSGLFTFDGIKANWAWDKVKFEYMQGNFVRGLTYSQFWYAPNQPPTGAWDFDNKPGSLFTDLNIDGWKVSTKFGKLDVMLGKNRFVSLNGPVVMDYNFGYVKYPLSNTLVFTGEYGKNMEATSEGTFWLTKLTIGDRDLRKKGASNVNLQYLRGNANSVNYTYSSQDMLDEGMSNGAKVVNINFNYGFGNNKFGRLEYGRTKMIGDLPSPFTAFSEGASYSYHRAVFLVMF